MSRFISFLIALMLSTTSATVYAQWNILSGLFTQMDATTKNQYFTDLGAMNQSAAIDSLNKLTLLSVLIKDLKDDKIGGTLDSSILELLGAGLDTLNEDGGTDFDIESLGDVLDLARDSILMQDPSWSGGYFAGIPNIYTGNTMLKDSFTIVSNSVPSTGGGDFESIFDQLFNGFSFPLLEMAFGTQSADLKYYANAYSSNAAVIRLGSVLGFDSSIDPHPWQGIFGLYPLEASWHVEASFLKAASNGNGELPPSEPDNINPLLLSGDFNIIITPYFILHPNFPFRIFTSLGMELGTYAPAHKDYLPPLTSDNKGFTTGFGPQVGLGFAFAKGPLVLYTHNTLAYGSVYCGIDEIHPTYKYNSLKFEAGLRYSNFINIRYSRGNSSWQPNNNRSAVIKNQVTIGIILPGL